jgi:hypothetical protein
MAIDKNKTEFTAEEEALIQTVFNEYIDMQCKQVPEEDVVSIINDIWADMDLAPPEVVVLESPAACKKACPDMSEYATYWNMWLCSYAATYDFAKRIGVEFDEEKYRKFYQWCERCPFVLFNETKVFVSRKPVKLHFNSNGQLHCDDGMSCEYSDGWGIYTINGVSVDKQIVMSPETQTIDQLRSEQNEEVKRVRIERYGWGKFLEEIGALTIDENVNDIEGTKEFLVESDKDKMKALMCVCPSTGKEFFLEVPPETKTCREAQAWLSNGFSSRIISAS